jgi:demethylmenaquinone methyltransferase/2-methoxy-6-polyprenyl-1,4-benzoquinol methylase
MTTADARNQDARPGSGAMFDAISGRYDLVNRIVSLGLDQGWRKKTVASLALGAGQRVLDLATGTGDLAIAIAEIHPDVTVEGSDPSEGMLAVGRTKVDARGLGSRVSLVTGDAMAIDRPDGSFDAATIAFGIRNVPDRPRALAEIFRVLRPGGRLGILELSEPRRGPLAGLARLHVHTVVPTIGSWLSGAGEYRYLEKSIAAFPPADVFAQTVRDAGFESVEARPLTFGVVHLYVGRKPRADA